MDCSTPGLPVHQQLPELTQIHVHWVEMPFDILILCHPLLLLLSIFPSIRVFSNESVLRIRWSKYWSFSFSISPTNEYSGLISFRIDWFDFPVVQGILKSLLQHHSWRASILQCSAFLTVQLSHPHMTIGKTIASTRRTLEEIKQEMTRVNIDILGISELRWTGMREFRCSLYLLLWAGIP